MKLTAAHLTEIAKLNPAAHKAIVAHKTLRKLRNVGFYTKAAGFARYLGEGEDIAFFTPTGKSTSASMVTESSMGCQRDSFNYAVGQYTPPLPEGTWIVCCQLFLGKWILSVEYVGQLALKG